MNILLFFTANKSRKLNKCCLVSLFFKRKRLTAVVNITNKYNNNPFNQLLSLLDLVKYSDYTSDKDNINKYQEIKYIINFYKIKKNYKK